MKTAKTVDVTRNQRGVADFIGELLPLREPIEIRLNDRPVARLVPPGELTEAEKEQILQAGWTAVQKARARNQDVPEREIGKAVDAAVRRARSRR